MARERYQGPAEAARTPDQRNPRSMRGEATARDGRPPMVELKSALVDAPMKKAVNAAELIAATEEYADVRIYFREPTVSPSGKSFGCGWGVTEAGSVKLAVSAYIPIPKEDRWRYAHLAADARDAKAAKGKARDEEV